MPLLSDCVKMALPSASICTASPQAHCHSSRYLFTCSPHTLLMQPGGTYSFYQSAVQQSLSGSASDAASFSRAHSWARITTNSVEMVVNVSLDFRGTLRNCRIRLNRELSWRRRFSCTTRSCSDAAHPALSPGPACLVPALPSASICLGYELQGTQHVGAMCANMKEQCQLSIVLRSKQTVPAGRELQLAVAVRVPVVCQPLSSRGARGATTIA